MPEVSASTPLVRSARPAGALGGRVSGVQETGGSAVLVELGFATLVVGAEALALVDGVVVGGLLEQAAASAASTAGKIGATLARPRSP